MQIIVRELLEGLSEPQALVYAHWDTVTDNSRPFLPCSDASKDGSVATLEQEQDDRPVRLILFIRRATIESGCYWTPLRLEAASIVWSITHLRGYLFMRHRDLNIFQITSARKSRPDRGQQPTRTAMIKKCSHHIQGYAGISQAQCKQKYRSSISLTTARHRECDRTCRRGLSPSDEERISSSAPTAFFSVGPPPCVSAWVGWRPQTRVLA